MGSEQTLVISRSPEDSLVDLVKISQLQPDSVNLLSSSNPRLEGLALALMVALVSTTLINSSNNLRLVDVRISNVFNT